MKNKEAIKKSKYAYVLMFEGKPFHMCCYESKPTIDDLQSLLEEIMTKKQFKKHKQFVQHLDKITYVVVGGKKLKNFLTLLSEEKEPSQFVTVKHSQ